VNGTLRFARPSRKVMFVSLAVMLGTITATYGFQLESRHQRTKVTTRDVAAAASTVAAASGSQAVAGVPGSQDLQSAKAVFVRAMVLRQTDVVPISLARKNAVVADSEVLSQPSTSYKGSLTRSTAGDAAAMFQHAQQALSEVFAPQLAASELQTVAGVVPTVTDPEVRILDGGVSDITYKSAVVSASDPNVVKISALVKAWGTLAQTLPGRAPAIATSHNTLVVDATLTKSGPSWLVASYNWSFLPGTEP
jgi:hypothetical protein